VTLTCVVALAPVGMQYRWAISILHAVIVEHMRGDARGWSGYGGMGGASITILAAMVDIFLDCEDGQEF